MSTVATKDEPQGLFDENDNDIFSLSLDDFDSVFDNFLKHHGISNPFKSHDEGTEHHHGPGMEANHVHENPSENWDHDHIPLTDYEGSTI